MSILIASWILAIVCGTYIGANKNRIVSGIVWSSLFGWFGVIVVCCLPNLGQKCKFCGGVMNKGFTVCPHCRNDNK